MAKTTQEKLLDSFTAIAGREAPDPGAALAATRDLATALEDAAPQAGSASEAMASSVAQALIESTIASLTGNTGPAASSSSAGSGGGVTAFSVAKTVLESGLGLIPLIGGLIGLFSGGGSSAPPTLVKYAMPPALDFQAAETGVGLTSVGYDQMGAPRALGNGTDSQSSTPTGDYAGGPGESPAQIAASTQAMDARWFMDHSADIAAAVRNAMLNLNSINDVVNDL